MEYKIKRCIVKDNKEIRKLLNQVIREKELSLYDVVETAKKKGHVISYSNLSRYLNRGNVRSAIPQEQIIYLCKQFGIELNLTVRRK